MLKNVKNRVWAFDCEWVPDPLAGRLLHEVPEDVTDPEAIMRIMWDAGGATDDDPTPFLKTALCRVVSIAAVERKQLADGEVALKLVSLPHEPDDPEDADEAAVVGRFLHGLGERMPQLVGFNSIQSDLKILVQRGIILGVRAAGFCARPNKPWEGVDYFARASDWNIDLKEVLGGWGKTVPSLHEIAVQSGIPGKMDADGAQVAALWLRGELRRIVQYNELDALTTYLVWLRVAHFCGHFDEAGYAEEQQRVRALLEAESTRPDRAHLRLYLDEWTRLQDLIEAGRPRRRD